MIKICIKDLTECKSLDKEALSRIQGGIAEGEHYPGSIEGMIAKYMELIPALPEIPMPYEPSYPNAPGGPAEDPGPIGGPY